MKKYFLAGCSFISLCLSAQDVTISKDIKKAMDRIDTNTIRAHIAYLADDKLKGRRYFDIAYRKASQVWITGYKTGEYERMVFADKLNYKDFGIELPDLMGWEGGQPIQLDTETLICCGFSGFQGVNDLGIVTKAANEAMK